MDAVTPSTILPPARQRSKKELASKVSKQDKILRKLTWGWMVTRKRCAQPLKPMHQQVRERDAVRTSGQKHAARRISMHTGWWTQSVHRTRTYERNPQRMIGERVGRIYEECRLGTEH